MSEYIEMEQVMMMKGESERVLRAGHIRKLWQLVYLIFLHVSIRLRDRVSGCVRSVLRSAWRVITIGKEIAIDGR